MNELEKAARQALEALELEEAQTHYPPQWLLSAITALRRALEQPAYRAVKTWHDGKPVYVAEQPAQQEPVAYVRNEENPCYMSTVLHERREQPEPVAKVCHDLEGHIGWNPALEELPDEGTPLYTRSQARELVGIDAGDWNKIAYTSEFRAGADWAEAKLKEKNK